MEQYKGINLNFVLQSRFSDTIKKALFMVQIALGSIYIHNYLLGNQEKGEERKGSLYFSYPFPFILNSPQPS